MTATTTERDAALARLREVVRPGSLVYTSTYRTRSGRPRVDLHVTDGPVIRCITVLVAEALGRRLSPDGRVTGREPRPLVEDDLSVALHGYPAHLGWRQL